MRAGDRGNAAPGIHYNELPFVRVEDGERSVDGTKQPPSANLAEPIHRAALHCFFRNPSIARKKPSASSSIMKWRASSNKTKSRRARPAYWLSKFAFTLSRVL